jgi:hypothetical protein
MSAVILALAVVAAGGAPDLPGADVSPAAQRTADVPATWRVDVGVALLREAWDFNESVETLASAALGADRRVWRGLAVRGELLGLRVWQDGHDAWAGGFTIGTRTRWGKREIRPVVDIAVGLSRAGTPVPPRGTRFNYLAVIGAGVERAAGSVVLAVTGRWLHASNNGREGRHLNPDIQALGVSLGVGWEH